MAKFTYEQEKSFIKLKRFRNESGVMAIICWLFTILFILINPNKLKDLFIIPIAGIIMTIIFLRMGYMVRDIIKLKKQLGNIK